jgi:proteic killer suppression protein
VAIQSFASKALQEFFIEGRLPRRAGWLTVPSVVARKLDMLDYAFILSDLAAPPGNRLEALKGNLAGLQSIRINNQWRVIFRWTDFGPADVDIVDYH